MSDPSDAVASSGFVRSDGESNGLSDPRVEPSFGPSTGLGAGIGTSVSAGAAAATAAALRGAGSRPSPTIDPEAPQRFSKHREEALHNFLAYSEPFIGANRAGWERAARVGRVRQTAIERECGPTIALFVCVIRWIVGLVKGTAEVQETGSAAEQSELGNDAEPSAADALGGSDSRGNCGVSAARFFSGVRRGFAAASSAAAAAAATGAVEAGSRVNAVMGADTDLLSSTIGLARVRNAGSSGRGGTRVSVREAAAARAWRSRPGQSSPFPVRPRSRPAPYIAAWEREFDSKSRIQGLAFGGAL